MDKVERLVNLIALLLETRRPLTVDEIRRSIPGYGGQSAGAFRRMFERDKQELRDVGIPLELAATDAWETEQGYRIPRQALLEDPGLTAAERAALSLAAQAWREQAPGDVTMGLLKLGAEDAGGGWMVPQVDLADPNVRTLLDAVTRRKRVTFRYRTRGSGAGEERTVDPYVLTQRTGWYLAGYDHARAGVRRFKCARIEGAVAVAGGKRPDFPPPPEDAVEPLRAPWEGEALVEARVSFAPQAAWWAERRTGARRLAERPDGWVEIALPVAEEAMFVTWVLGFGDHAVLEDPPRLREEVVDRLRAAAGTT